MMLRISFSRGFGFPDTERQLARAGFRPSGIASPKASRNATGDSSSRNMSLGAAINAAQTVSNFFRVSSITAI